MMKKRVFTILMTAVLAFTCAAGPVCYAAASEGATNEVAEEVEENIPEETAVKAEAFLKKRPKIIRTRAFSSRARRSVETCTRKWTRRLTASTKIRSANP